ncbi:energy-coupling factor transporter transmembrane component T family protein [Planktothrix paucivesiculata]|uniref:ABC-type transporter, integral membrane subunit n=1 Tax=Planktothrix paucivesiculata PCC 9631 TaxID=671071 RepID=A0A7Z9E191_9CYAN|nr:energy-coupling factor transporter transmembrane component T [Planktothrix paucivesiculata]VXD22551.1 ABC-type transporter, integral membrane subunit [Planktothrix paucivesiculata PCC 9631]
MIQFSIPFKLRVSLILVIGIALLKTSVWWALGSYGAIAFFWVILLKPPLKIISKLLGAELILLSLLALPMGYEKASFMVSRSLLCLLIMNSFLITLPPHSLGIALKGLPIPATFKEIILLTGQYLEILISEVRQMQQAAKLRGLSGYSGWLRYTSAAMIGSLYLRSLDRAERVYNAMILRGYQGKLPVESLSTPRDNFALIIVGTIASLLTFFSYVKN